MLRHNRIVVDLDAIRGNYRVLAEAMPQGVEVMPVIKADAYGHGLIKTAQALLSAGATRLAVAIPEEGIELRSHGIDARILVLGAATEAAAGAAIEHRLTQTVFTPHMVEHLNRAAERLKKTAYVNVKLDTGMGRIGLVTDGEAEALRLALDGAKNVEATGIYTHLAVADEPDAGGSMNAFTRAQAARFEALRSHFPGIRTAHVSNSAAALLYPELRYSLVREGIALYGYPPVKTSLPFRRAMRWETEIVNVKDIAPGCSVGYGRAFVADRPMRVATLAAGYGDGYHRAASGRARVLIGGKFADVLGRICMDQMMADVTNIPECRAGMTAVLLGRQGDNEIDAEMLAKWAGTISYEVLLAVTGRVPKEYTGI